MAKARIIFGDVTTPIEPTKVTTFTVIQNNRKQVIHVVDYISRGGSNRQMTFLNQVEATLSGARYIRAQSQLSLCAKLEFISEE
jgi:hypothetical protein